MDRCAAGGAQHVCRCLDTTTSVLKLLLVLGGRRSPAGPSPPPCCIIHPTAHLCRLPALSLPTGALSSKQPPPAQPGWRLRQRRCSVHAADTAGALQPESARPHHHRQGLAQQALSSVGRLPPATGVHWMPSMTGLKASQTSSRKGCPHWEPSTVCISGSLTLAQAYLLPTIVSPTLRPHMSYIVRCAPAAPVTRPPSTSPAALGCSPAHAAPPFIMAWNLPCCGWMGAGATHVRDNQD